MVKESSKSSSEDRRCQIGQFWYIIFMSVINTSVYIYRYRHWNWSEMPMSCFWMYILDLCSHRSSAVIINVLLDWHLTNQCFVGGIKKGIGCKSTHRRSNCYIDLFLWSTWKMLTAHINHYRSMSSSTEQTSLIHGFETHLHTHTHTDIFTPHTAQDQTKHEHLPCKQPQYYIFALTLFYFCLFN